MNPLIIILPSFALLMVAAVYFGSRKRSAKYRLQVKDWKKDVVYMFGPIQVLSDYLPDGQCSPFCLKLDLWLRATKIPFELLGVRTQGPNSKWPYIELNGAVLADSNIIIETLRTKFNADLNRGLTASQKAIGTAWQRLCEDHLYWVMLYQRWEGCWDDVRRFFFPSLPFFIQRSIREKTREYLYGQGMGRMTAAEVELVGRQDFDALSAFLAERKTRFLVSDGITTFDCAAFGLLCNILNAPFMHPIVDYARSLKPLCDYVDAILDSGILDLKEKLKPRIVSS